MTTDLATLASAILSWLQALRLYLAIALVLDLVAEAGQLPFYVGWSGAPLWLCAVVLASSVAHAVMAQAGALVAALVVAGDPLWPRQRFWPVAALTFFFGVFGYWGVFGCWSVGGAPPRLGWAAVLEYGVVPGLGQICAARVGAWSVAPPRRTLRVKPRS